MLNAGVCEQPSNTSVLFSQICEDQVKTGGDFMFKNSMMIGVNVKGHMNMNIIAYV